MKIAALLIALALLLVACATPAVEPTTTTEEPTTEYITTPQEATTVFEPRYLSEAEIDEIFDAAWRLHWDITTGEFPVEWDWAEGWPPQDAWLRIVPPSQETIDHPYVRTPFYFRTLASMLATLREHFSPELTDEIMNYWNEPTFMDIDGALHIVSFLALGDRGAIRAEIGSIQLVEQTDTHRVYHLILLGHDIDGNLVVPYDEPHIFTRELIDGRWVFTSFPFYW